MRDSAAYNRCSVGLPVASAAVSTQVLCTLPPFLSKHLLSVAPVVAQVPASFTPVPNPDEVAHVFHMPLSAFLDSSKHIHYDMKTATG